MTDESLIEETICRFSLHDDYFYTVEDIMIQLEKAYWFYFDNHGRITEKDFLTAAFKMIPRLKKENIDKCLQKKSKIKLNSVICVALCITKDRKKVLVQTRCDDKKTEVPMGKLKSNETYLDGALRELREETGYIVKNREDVKEFEVVSRPKKFKVFLIPNCEEVEFRKVTTNRESVNHRWGEISELLKDGNVNDITRIILDKFTNEFPCDSIKITLPKSGSLDILYRDSKK